MLGDRLVGAVVVGCPCAGATAVRRGGSRAARRAVPVLNVWLRSSGGGDEGADAVVGGGGQVFEDFGFVGSQVLVDDLL